MDNRTQNEIKKQETQLVQRVDARQLSCLACCTLLTPRHNVL